MSKKLAQNKGKILFQGQEEIGVSMTNRRKISPYTNLHLKLCCCH